MAFFGAYVIYIVAVRLVAGQLIGFKAVARNLRHFFALLGLASAILVTTLHSVALTYAVGSLATLVVSVYSARRLNKLVNLREWIKMVGTGARG